MSSLSSLKESLASAASTEIDIIPSTSYQRMKGQVDTHEKERKVYQEAHPHKSRSKTYAVGCHTNERCRQHAYKL